MCLYPIDKCVYIYSTYAVHVVSNVASECVMYHVSIMYLQYLPSFCILSMHGVNHFDHSSFLGNVSNPIIPSTFVCSLIQSCDVDDMLRRTTRCTPTTNERCHTWDHSHRLAWMTHGGMHLSRGPIDVWNSLAMITQMMSVLVEISRTSSQYKSSCFITTKKEGVFTHPKLVLWVIFLWI